ncbi:TrkH family potassium uptake protein [Tissierella sp. Yu-01]|uniref:TrkH family potassium uptake protein n=1 Tax=Tissierella sp. Yu-01 TaxID=3035694 RepID=UPI00240D85F9|nr:TrkH family potassium uptake protein [Tissierella sp. Yu-01]WFA08201.1 TrkH family potassium uptake protein [Tissierella sp. Yu-01]
MNYGIIIKVIGYVLLVESVLLLPSFFIGLYTGEGDAAAFGITILLTLVIGFFLSRMKKGDSIISIREGLSIVSLSWIFVSLFGALPLYLTKSTSTYINALFEIVSGFTTTGATVISDVEGLTHGILFWRSFTHWVGGMGILVFSLALLPALGVGGFQLYKYESPGPVAGKIAPKLKNTAKILYTIYLGITILEVILLRIGGMSIFDSLVYTFGTVGTGGFATKNLSVGAYNSTYIHLIIAIFMTISGVNFSNYYLLLKGKVKDFLRDEEFKLYIAILVIAIVAMALNLYATTYDNLGTAFRDSYFQAASIMTTTGYSTVDFNLWSAFNKLILLVLMVIGGSAGSTAGGMKVIRILILFKMVKREVMKIFHPRAVVPIKVGGKIIPNETVSSIHSFTALYMIIFIVSTILISLEGIDIESAISSVAATLSNIGPGLNFVGPASNFGGFSQISIFYFTILMLLGRLELYTIFALIVPKKWSNEY